MISKHSRLQISLSNKYKKFVYNRSKSLGITRSAYIRKLVIKDMKESKIPNAETIKSFNDFDKKRGLTIFSCFKEFWRNLNG